MCLRSFAQITCQIWVLARNDERDKPRQSASGKACPFVERPNARPSGTWLPRSAWVRWVVLVKAVSFQFTAIPPLRPGPSNVRIHCTCFSCVCQGSSYQLKCFTALRTQLAAHIVCRCLPSPCPSSLFQHDLPNQGPHSLSICVYGGLLCPWHGASYGCAGDHGSALVTRRVQRPALGLDDRLMICGLVNLYDSELRCAYFLITYQVALLMMGLDFIYGRLMPPRGI